MNKIFYAKRENSQGPLGWRMLYFLRLEFKYSNKKTNSRKGSSRATELLGRRKVIHKMKGVHRFL